MAVTCTYLVKDGLSVSFSGDSREADVSAAVKGGARLLFTQEFAPEITAYERAQFREGVFAGYWSALSQVRDALGIRP